MPELLTIRSDTVEHALEDISQISEADRSQWLKDHGLDRAAIAAMTPESYRNARPTIDSLLARGWKL